MDRLESTQQTVRCPLEDRAANLTVLTDHGAAPSGRHREVTACSLMSSTPFVPAPRRGHFADVTPTVSYRRGADAAPRHASHVMCSRRCLAVLNAAEAGVSEPLRCTSGFSDAHELARRTQSSAMMRILLSYSP